MSLFTRSWRNSWTAPVLSRPASPEGSVHRFPQSERSDAGDGHFWLPVAPAGLLLPHGSSLQGDAVGVKDESIENGIGKCGVSYGAVPVVQGQLARNECGSAAVAVLQDLKEVAALGIDRRGEPEISRPAVCRGSPAPRQGVPQPATGAAPATCTQLPVCAGDPASTRIRCSTAHRSGASPRPSGSVARSRWSRGSVRSTAPQARPC
jgi:hypothetical protein